MTLLPPPTASAAPSLSTQHTTELVARWLDAVERAVVGKRDALELIVTGLLANGHVLLDDLPGVAKTLSARSLAATAGMEFSRVQFTPDILPADITGAMVLDLETNGSRFQPGPIFAQIVLADEINRAPAKAQAALLEAMQERQVTVDTTTHRLPAPFLVIATQNPVESEGTYPLPEAQLDRFILRTRIGYPSQQDESALLSRRIQRRTDEVDLEPAMTTDDFLAAQAAVESVHVESAIVDYVVAIVRSTRGDRQVEVGSSPRGSLALLKLARASALIRGRDFVTPDDVRRLAIPALAHRLVLTAEAWARHVQPESVVERCAAGVSAPT
ncbi:AAA family ATPase [Desertimonas flava]|uniref:AAA family ATPase n=1 Tax=Desertimonas flava TaxID=2064846 RepID=UPI000E35597B|nr:MoxR family ATPase [Desertimonas flava]